MAIIVELSFCKPWDVGQLYKLALSTLQINFLYQLLDNIINN